jgi:hypothetical protein
MADRLTDQILRPFDNVELVQTLDLFATASRRE